MITEDEFIEFMSNDFPHLKVTKNDLTHPTRQFVTMYYSEMLEQLYRMPVKHLITYNESQRELLVKCGQGPSLADHVVSYNLFMAVKYIFDKIKLFNTDFHYSDVLFPFMSPKRSFVFMATLYDFYSTCAEFDEFYENLDTIEKKTQVLAKLREKQIQLKELIVQNEEKKLLNAERVRDIKEQLADLSVRSNEDQLKIKELQEEEEVWCEKLRGLEEQERKFQSEFTKIDNERKYYESLIVADDNLIVETHSKLSMKKDHELRKLRELEQQVHDKCSKVSQFDTVLSLYDALNQALRGEVSVADKSIDLEGLHNAICALKKEYQALEKEEAKLQLLVKEKEEAIPCLQNELARLEGDDDSLACTWKEKEGRYRAHVSELQRALTDASHRAQLEEVAMKDILRKTSDIEDAIADKMEEIKQIDQRSKINFQKFEADLIRALTQIKEQTLAYRSTNSKV